MDVIVVGGGHAGCEAALAASRLGVRTLLISISKKDIGRLSCNPSIGGIAKSHITKELDILGGEQARNADFTGIQFRTLNTRKGPAVQACRAQCDKLLFPLRLQAVLFREPLLEIIEGTVDSILTESGTLRGVVLETGEKIYGRAVVVTSGTFMRGRVLIGTRVIQEGRWGQKSAEGISGSLEQLGFELGRLKTGTPPRIHKDSIHYEKIKIQPGDDPPPFFSLRAKAMFKEAGNGPERRGKRVTNSEAVPRRTILSGEEKTENDLRNLLIGEFQSKAQGKSSSWNIQDLDRQLLISDHRPQIPCWLTHTNEKTHQIIADNLKKSSLYGGLVSGTGVRYCPSIEDKIVKFPHQPAHHVFIEPEGRNNIRVYPNGTSNSLPEDVQVEIIRSIEGLEDAAFIRPGYAIEYDYAQPTQLFHTLETKKVENLYFAGQINGTTGYEEAAGQGFIAGINAARKISGASPFVLGRDEAYIGVLIDDLVLKGTDEPYRMFTSRAEHRLTLRQDNARFRLLGRAKEIGLISKEMISKTIGLQQEVEEETARLKKVFYEGASLAQILCRPGTRYEDLPGHRPDLDAEVVEQTEIGIKYEGYIRREQSRIKKLQNIELQAIPKDIDYNLIHSLRFEAREKLKKIRPDNLGQASRISGVNPADISILSVWLKQ